MKKLVLMVLLFCLIVPLYPATAQEESAPILAEVVPYHLNVRAEPSTDAAILGQFIGGTTVEVLGQADVGYIGSWLHVRQSESGLTGWVATRYLNFPPGTVRFPFEVPILWRDHRTPDPVHMQGVLVAHVVPYTPRRYRGVRSEPNWDAPILGRATSNSLVYVYGRLEERDEFGYLWIYVKALDSDLAGWMSRGVALPINFDILSLPALPPVANPPLPAPYIEPIASLSAVTVQTTGFYPEPGRRYDSELITMIPENTPLILTGRNANGRFFKTVYNGIEGWILWRRVQKGDPNRLPIMSLKGSPDNRSD